jgi:hypothetical protein
MAGAGEGAGADAGADNRLRVEIDRLSADVDISPKKPFNGQRIRLRNWMGTIEQLVDYHTKKPIEKYLIVVHGIKYENLGRLAMDYYENYNPDNWSGYYECEILVDGTWVSALPYFGFQKIGGTWCRSPCVVSDRRKWPYPRGK